MFYGYEKAVEARRREQLLEAEQRRLARAAVGDRYYRYQLRQSVGRFLVQVGNRLNNEPLREGQLAEPAGSLG